MKIGKIYKISGTIIGLSLGFVSLIFTFPIFFGVLGIFLMADSRSLFTPAWLIILGPVGITVGITIICYRISSRIGRRVEADIQNEEKNKKRARVVLLTSFLFLLVGCAVTIFGIFNLISSYKNLGRDFAKDEVATITEEKRYKDYASLGEISARFVEPYSELQGINSKLVKVVLYKKLEVAVPIIVKHVGNYEIFASYGTKGNDGIYSNVTSLQTQNQSFTAGEHTINFEFNNNSGWSSEMLDKATKIELNYMATRDEIIVQMNQETKNMSPEYQKLAQKAEETFNKFDSAGSNNIGRFQTVNKFVESKEFKF